MTQEELIEWARSQDRVRAVVHRLDPPLLGGFTYQVLLWHFVSSATGGYTGFVHAGFGRDFTEFCEAVKFARRCTDEVVIEHE